MRNRHVVATGRMGEVLLDENLAESELVSKFHRATLTLNLSCQQVSYFHARALQASSPRCDSQ